MSAKQKSKPETTTKGTNPFTPKNPTSSLPETYPAPSTTPTDKNTVFKILKAVFTLYFMCKNRTLYFL